VSQLYSILDVLTPEQRAQVTAPLAEHAASLVRDAIDAIDDEALVVELHEAITTGMREHVGEVAREPWNHLGTDAIEEVGEAIKTKLLAAIGGGS